MNTKMHTNTFREISGYHGGETRLHLPGRDAAKFRRREFNFVNFLNSFCLRKFSGVVRYLSHVYVALYLTGSLNINLLKPSGNFTYHQV
jgi:hypothetical protein